MFSYNGCNNNSGNINPNNHRPENNNHINAQPARPTSKTAIMVKKRRAMLEHLSCYICKGYLIDASTIHECMHSFCKSCIVKHLNKSQNCPKCGIILNKNDPLSGIKRDKVLQEIVYKLVPGLYDNEMSRRRDFYKHLFKSYVPDELDNAASLHNWFKRNYPCLDGEQFGVMPNPKPFYQSTDYIELSIEPHIVDRNDPSIYYDNLGQSVVTSFEGGPNQEDLSKDFTRIDSQHFKIYLECPVIFTIFQLKKFIVHRLSTTANDTIHILYLNESLRDEYSLIDVAYIYDWNQIDFMKLYYVVQRNKSPNNLNATQDPDQTRFQLSGTKRNNKKIETPAQTSTKRVCTTQVTTTNRLILANQTADLGVPFEQTRTLQSSIVSMSNLTTAKTTVPASSDMNLIGNISNSQRNLSNKSMSTSIEPSEHDRVIVNGNINHNMNNNIISNFRSNNDTNNNNIIARSTQSSHQVAVSYVTPKGITIRRLHNVDGTPMTTSSLMKHNLPVLTISNISGMMTQTVAKTTTAVKPIEDAIRTSSSAIVNKNIRSIQSLIGPDGIERFNTNGSQPQTNHNSISNDNHNTNSQTNSIYRNSQEHRPDHSYRQNFESQSEQSGSHSSNMMQMNLAKRHPPKIKPVYKQLVDPTKLKSIKKRS